MFFKYWINLRVNKFMMGFKFLVLAITKNMYLNAFGKMNIDFWLDRNIYIYTLICTHTYLFSSCHFNHACIIYTCCVYILQDVYCSN